MKQVVLLLLLVVCAIVLSSSSFGAEAKQIPISKIVKTGELDQPEDPINANCTCSTYACSCCVNNIPFINDLCVRLSWNPTNLTIFVVLVVNNVVVARQEIVDPEPLSICETIFTGCGICAGVSHLNITSQGACGEVDFSVNCLGFADAWNLGQFHLGQNCVVTQAAQAKHFDGKPGLCPNFIKSVIKKLNNENYMGAWSKMLNQKFNINPADLLADEAN